MKQSKLVTAPRKWKSATNHPEAHLAYITKEEQDLLIKKDLYKSLKGKPNVGPGGIPSLQGDMGSISRSSGQGRQDPEGGYAPEHTYSKTAKQMAAQGPQYQSGRGKGTVSTGDGVKKAAAVAGLTGVAKKIGNIFQQKAKGPTVEDTAAMEDAYVTHKPVPVGGGPGDRDGLQNTIATQSLVTAPTADKAAGFGHQWDFKAYDNQRAATTPNVYDYSKAPYAKKGKLVRKYATGQEIKNFSKGKRSGPPPLKGYLSLARTHRAPLHRYRLVIRYWF